MKENKSLKRKLIIQSFAPLFLILMIKNADRKIISLVIRLVEHFRQKNWLIILKIPFHPMFLTCLLEAVCLVWIVYAIISVKSFLNVQNSNFRSQGEKVTNVENISDTGVSFFMTYVLPMVLDDLGSPRGFLVFTVLMVLLYILIWKTNLYYQNPVLTILGYHIVSFCFETTQLADFQNQTCIGITRGVIQSGKRIKRQYITDNVFLIYENM